ncbi:MAG: beta keto-acyl synthase, partial [Polyangiaceae bacterium]
MLVRALPPGGALAGLVGGGRIEVIDDSLGIGGRIATRLSSAGVDAHVVAELSQGAAGAVFAPGLGPIRSPEDAVAIQRAALKAAKTLAKKKGQNRVLVTLQDTGGDFGLAGRAGERVWVGGLSGLVKTAAAEWPDAAVKVIDVSSDGVSPEEVADRVAAELLRGGQDVEVALGPNGERSVVRHEPAPYSATSAGSSRVRPGSVLVVTGGARGV